MLDDIPVTAIPGVGQAKQKCLAELGLDTVHRLLHHFPLRYEDRRISTIDGYTEPTLVTVQAIIEGSPKVQWRGRKSVVRAYIRVDYRHLITALWFNQHYLMEQLTDGRMLVITGKLDPNKRTLVATHTNFKIGRKSETDFIPVYRAVKGLSTAYLQQIIEKALELYADQLVELLPLDLVQKYRLISHRQAVEYMHRMPTQECRRQAHRRLIFEEFFLFQLQLQSFRARRRHTVTRHHLAIPAGSFQVFSEALPFALTVAQKRSCEEITIDLGARHAMVRLLQGDVGSGKTWVALWAAYAVARCGGQTALMAPTEILAEQHYDEAVKRLTPLGVRITLLTGHTPPKERRHILERLAAGSIDLVIGTHALLTQDVQFQGLELVITDEQHRFGVSQRSGLRDKGEMAHFMMMTATPIPRTLALAVYGDLDISVLDERPAGRKPIHTVRCRPKDEPKIVRWARQALAAGRQVYVVAPLIEETEETVGILSAVELEKKFRDEFAGFRVALLHGRMPGREKDEIMRAFVSGAISVLVSTTVIEVGIDVPNATMIIIYHAERFGLAQLHQLRGRVGRGLNASTCVLVSDATADLPTQRLRTLEESEDGFFIADRDLALRGPGEFLGVRQSGLPEFSVGNVTSDIKVMEVARDEATTLVNGTDFWILPKYSHLRSALEDKTRRRATE